MTIVVSQPYYSLPISPSFWCGVVAARCEERCSNHPLYNSTVNFRPLVLSNLCLFSRRRTTATTTMCLNCDRNWSVLQRNRRRLPVGLGRTGEEPTNVIDIPTSQPAQYVCFLNLWSDDSKIVDVELTVQLSIHLSGSISNRVTCCYFWIG